MKSVTPSQLFTIVPHRPPMVWIDHVTEYGEHRGTAILSVKSDGLYMTDGLLRDSASIELIAQAYAFCNAAYLKFSKSSENLIARAFLAAIKDFKSEGRQITAGTELRIEVTKLRNFGPIALIRGEVFAGQELVAGGELKVFAQ